MLLIVDNNQLNKTQFNRFLSSSFVVMFSAILFTPNYVLVSLYEDEAIMQLNSAFSPPSLKRCSIFFYSLQI